MKIQLVWRRFFAALTALLLAVCCSPAALAYGAIDTGREASLTVFFGKDGDGFSRVEFQIYRAAEVSEGGTFTLTGDFADYPVQVNGLDSSGWRALAQTLEGYAARDGLPPMQAEETGRDGRAVFSHLETGLYLVTGERFRQGRYTYTPEPFLVSLPTLDEAGAWVYDAAAACKYDSDYTPPSDGDSGDVNRKVLKVWKDDGNEDKRPEEIVVQLLRDGKVYDTVTLSGENNWRHMWTGLDSDYSWKVVEEETPEGYTVTVDRQGITFVMTNTYEETPPEEPEEPDTPDGPGTPEEPGLPQTGMLWWPAPLLACGGLLLFLIGWGMRRYEKHEG